MAQNKLHVTVFLATPSDIRDERAVVKNVIDELNNSICKQLDMHLDLLGWENVYPSIGEDAQDVVNSQLQNYDIFIGIMWKRYGTPTKRESSGTREEFEIAMEKHRSDSNSVHLMFYFCNRDIPQEELDIDQFLKVREFKKELSSKGLFIKEYSGADDFAQILRLNLSAMLNAKYSRRINISDHQTSTSLTIWGEDEDEVGLYEYNDLFLEYIGESTASLERITEHMNELGQKTDESVASITLAKTKPQNARERETRRIFDNLGDHLMNFASRVNVDVPILDENFSKAITYYGKALEIQSMISSNEKDNELIIETLTSLRTTIKNSNRSFIGMRNSVSSVPPLTTKFAKAKKEAIRSMNYLISNLESHVNLVDQMILTAENREAH